MTDKELMQQALDALEGYARNCQCEGGGAPCDAAEALRARLAQPEQEPVAWISHNAGLYHGKPDELLNPLPLYTAPPKKEWVGLTDEEYEEMAEQYVTNCYFDTLEYAKNIEAKLKEKNGF
jgi:hypothetical protein